MIQQIPLTPETNDLLKKLILAPNEGVMFVKFVLLKQETLTNGIGIDKVNAAQGVVLLGDLEEMKTTLAGWMNEAVQQYKA